MKKHNLILVTFFSLTMATGCYNGHILDKPITMLANDKKTALTPPTSYEYSVKLHSGSPVEWGPVWSYYDNSGVVPSGYDRFLLNNIGSELYQSIQSMLVPIWSEEPTNNRILLDFKFRKPTPISAYYGVYEINYSLLSMSGSAPIFDLTIENPTPHEVRLYLDISSGLSNKPFSYRINGLQVANDIYLYYASLNSFYIPAFATTRILSSISSLSIDAFYFDILPLSDGMIGFASENYDSGFGGGFDEGWRSIDNLQWLENVATAVKDIFSVEILPGFTIGFIVLFPLVVAIVKWFLSLFGIGGGS